MSVIFITSFFLSFSFIRSGNSEKWWGSFILIGYSLSSSALFQQLLYSCWKLAFSQINYSVLCQQPLMIKILILFLFIFWLFCLSLNSRIPSINFFTFSPLLECHLQPIFKTELCPVCLVIDVMKHLYYILQS